MVHHVLTFTEAEDFAQAVAHFALLKGEGIQLTTNSTTNVIRIYSEEECDQNLIADAVDKYGSQPGFALWLEETETPAELLDELNSLRKENAKLQNELTKLQNNLQNELNNLQKCKDLYESVYISTNKELERYKAAVNLFREQLNLIFPQKQ